MGTLSPPPVPPGEGCTICWGPDKPFGDIDTPKYIIAIFRDVKPNERSCEVDAKPPIPPIPAEVAILLEQLIDYPCRYENNVDLAELGWGAFLNLNVSTIELRRKREGLDCYGNPEDFFDFLFQDTSQPPCSDHFFKNNYHQGHYEGHGGSADIYW